MQSDPAAIARLVREANFPPGGHVLDAGCGPGLVSSGLLDAGLDVVGVDLSTEMIERGRASVVWLTEAGEFLRSFALRFCSQSIRSLRRGLIAICSASCRRPARLSGAAGRAGSS